MSRLSKWLGHVRRIKQRKASCYRAYHSEAIVVRMEQVVAKPRRKRRK